MSKSEPLSEEALSEETPSDLALLNARLWLRERRPPEPSSAQVFAELQKKLDDDALKKSYTALIEQHRRERAQVDSKFDVLTATANRWKRKAQRAERAPKIWRGAFFIALLFLCIELARHGL